ncbi:multi-copper polyphenol oxidoreductase laccase [Candidatus Campylobacter infans]|uniref:Multi-copper polyphenol oxidoreductase laccase n=1 Tax=Candidatus Campylobacter infans TaxID=2561898 RepID=A0A7H9CJV1_9BACT|nr:polyphenol oxidase family protein [Candidatus Campylobacter infans]QLI05901.1 multi-copper polyphenol oxidoreductase laccase [Candidatus Campylobacter infans]
MKKAKFLATFTNRFGLLGGENFNANLAVNGASSGVFANFNLALHTGDCQNALEKNESILKREIGARMLVFMEQIHSDKIYELKSTKDLRQKTKISYEIKTPCDAIITSLKGVGICVMVADCAPVILIDEKQVKIAVIHAGRAGVCAKIISKCLNAMKSQPQDLKLLIGAHIKGACYEVGGLDLGDFNRYKNKGFFDITQALKDEINALGIKNYEISDICTHCDDNFYSYRRDKICGRQVGVAMIL